MAYSSKADAVAKLIQPKTDHNGLNLYPNNLLFDSTTIFYSNSAKTILATAGNYVFATNYNSLYVTLGSDGKIIGTVSNLNADSSDTTWIDDRIYDNGNLVSNQCNIGGTSLSITNNVITDAVWFTRQYTNSKAWIINNGILNTSDLVNINVSDMKGYDLMIYTGEYVNYNWIDNNVIQAFCHIKAEANRQTIFGNKIYFFKPDYWIPNPSFTGGVTYFRRMPNITSINDRYGRKKLWIDMVTPVHDFAENYGVPRTSTRLNKGITHILPKSAYGYTQTPSKDKKIDFRNDEWIIGATAFVKFGYTPENINSIWFDNNLDNMAVTMIESLIVNDSTWDGGISPTTGIAYKTANPYHWKTTNNSGTNSDKSPFEGLKYFYYNVAYSNGDQVQFDGEYYPKGIISSMFGQAFNELRKNVKQLILYDINEIGNGAVDVNFSQYANGGIYISDTWANITTSNYTSTNMYNAYHNYVINNSISLNSIISNKFYIGGYEAYQLSFITKYQTHPIWNFSIYALVHSFDISKKAFAELWTTADNRTRCMIYTWIREEILPKDPSNANFRLTNPIQNGARPDQSPSLNQSLGVWGMAYADGFFAWNETAGLDIDEFNTNDPCQQLGRASWDWVYVGYWQVWQNKDIVEAATDWLVPDYEKSAGVWTTTTENYPISLFAFQRPLCRYKLSADGTKALVICVNPFNNGYTKATHKFRLPAKSNYEFTIDTWGTYTSVVRLINL
jgi:DUF971 family protein